MQTEKKVRNVTISGFGTLDSHYTPDDDIVGVGDDGTRETIVLMGKDIRVFGVTLLNTNPQCHAWGYCLSINPNWTPLANYSDLFDASELQTDPPYKFRKAHCQVKEHNMNCVTRILSVSHNAIGGIAPRTPTSKLHLVSVPNQTHNFDDYDCVHCTLCFPNLSICPDGLIGAGSGWLFVSVLLLHGHNMNSIPVGTIYLYN